MLRQCRTLGDSQQTRAALWFLQSSPLLERRRFASRTTYSYNLRRLDSHGDFQRTKRGHGLAWRCLGLNSYPSAPHPPHHLDKHACVGFQDLCGLPSLGTPHIHAGDLDRNDEGPRLDRKCRSAAEAREK